MYFSVELKEETNAREKEMLSHLFLFMFIHYISKSLAPFCPLKPKSQRQNDFYNQSTITFPFSNEQRKPDFTNAQKEF